MNIEHLLVFWLTGAFTMIMLSLLAYSTVFANSELTSGIGFVMAEAQIIGQKTFPLLSSLFLLIAGLMLFSTQFSVLDATSRIMSENFIILSPKRFRIEKLPTYFYLFLWLQIFAGIIIFSLGFSEPLTLIIIGAVLNAITMFFYCGLVLWLNLTSLAKPLRPSLIRISALVGAFLFFGIFGLFTIFQNIISF